MAESRSERTERRGWLLALIVLFIAVGAWQVLRRGGAPSRDGDGIAPGMTGGARPSSGSLGGYLQYVDERASQGITAAEPALTAEGIHRLAEAIADVGNRSVARSALVRPTVDSLHDQADRVAAERDAATQARLTRAALVTAAGAISRMQQHGYPTLEPLAVEMRAAADAVSERQALGEQHAAVQSFFERAAAVLRNMSPQAV